MESTASPFMITYRGVESLSAEEYGGLSVVLFIVIPQQHGGEEARF